MDIPKEYMPSPQTYFRFYDFLDKAEDFLSAGAAIPLPVIGSAFADLKIITSAVLLALGLSMCVTATGIHIQAHLTSRPLSAELKEFTVNLRGNSAHFIKHGVGNFIAGYYVERHIFLSTASWLVRIALRSVMAEKEKNKVREPEKETIQNRLIEIVTWPFKDLFKIMGHIKNVNKVQSQRMDPRELQQTSSGLFNTSAEPSRSSETCMDVDVEKISEEEMRAQQAQYTVFAHRKLTKEHEQLKEAHQQLKEVHLKATEEIARLQQKNDRLQREQGTYL